MNTARYILLNEFGYVGWRNAEVVNFKALGSI